MDSPEEDQNQIADVLANDTENATQFDPNDAPPHKQELYRRLRFYNTGEWNGPKREEKEVRHRLDNLHRLDALASSLPLTKQQRKRARSIFDDIDLNEVNRPIDYIIFAVCVVVANADTTDGFRYWPHPDISCEDEEFEEVAEELDLSCQQQLSVIHQVLRHTSL